MLLRILLPLLISLPLFLTQNCSSNIYTVDEPGVFSEGIALSPDGNFFLGDITAFALLSNSPYTGNLRLVSCDGSLLSNSNVTSLNSSTTVGVETSTADFPSSTLAITTVTVDGRVILFRGNLSDPSPLVISDASPGTHFYNDLAITSLDNDEITVFVTDSSINSTGATELVQYNAKIDPSTGSFVNATRNSGSPNCFSPNAQQTGDPTAFGLPIGLNGVVRVGDDVLLAGQSSSATNLTSAIWRYPTTCDDTNPGTLVEYDESSLAQGPQLSPTAGNFGIDGMFYHNNSGWLYFIAGDFIYRACTTDNWQTAFIQSRDELLEGIATVTVGENQDEDGGYAAYVVVAFPPGASSSTNQQIIKVTYPEGDASNCGVIDDESSQEDGAGAVRWMWM